MTHFFCKKSFFVGIIGLPLITFFGCCCADLGKRPLNDRVFRIYPTIGITLEQPKHPCREDIADSLIYQQNANIVARMAFAMYPIGGTLVTEPQYLLNFSFSRLSPSAFELFKRGEHCENSDYVFGCAPSVFQPTISEKVVTHEMWQQCTYRCFRKDIRLSNGDYVIAGAKLLEKPLFFVDLSIEIKAVYEILDSIKPIE